MSYADIRGLFRSKTHTIVFCRSPMLLCHLTHHSKLEYNSRPLHYFTISLPNFTCSQQYLTISFSVSNAIGIGSRTVKTVVSRYNDWATRPKSYIYLNIYNLIVYMKNESASGLITHAFLNLKLCPALSGVWRLHNLWSLRLQVSSSLLDTFKVKPAETFDITKQHGVTTRNVWTVSFLCCNDVIRTTDRK